MIGLIASLLLLIQPADSARTIAPDCTPELDLTASEMREAGLTRLHDLLRLADLWDTYSKDGFTWHAGAGGFVPPGSSEWQLSVGNHPVNLWNPGGITLNRLPLSPGMISAVRMNEHPGFVGGRLSEGGSMRVALHRPQQGFQVRARGVLGNEAGDPGPFFYTDRAAQNVDKSGPDASLELGYGSERFFVHGMASVQRDFPTDGALITRYLETYAGYPTLLVLSSALHAGIDFGSGTHTLLSGGSYFDHYFTREETMELLPARSHLTLNGISGQWGTAAVTWEYVLQHTFNRLEPRGDLPASEFYFNYQEMLAGATWTRSRPSLETRLGARLIRARMSAAENLSERATIGTASVQIAVPARVRDRVSLQGSLSSDGTTAALKAGIEYRAVLSDAHGFWLNGFGGGRLVQEDVSHWHHVASSLPGHPAGETAVVSPSSDDRSATWHAAFGWNWRVAGNTNLEASTTARHLRRPVLDQYFPVDPLLHQPTGRVEGTTLVSSLSIEHEPHQSLLQRLTLKYRQNLSGRPLWEKATESLPAGNARYTVIFRPLEDLSLWGRVEYDGPRTWRGIPGVLHQPPSSESHRLRPSLTFHFSLQKYFLDEQLRAGILLRNVHDGYRRFHPHGKHFNMILFLQVEVGLPGIR